MPVLGSALKFMIRATVIGGTGYTGLELIRLLLEHPQAELVSVCSRTQAGRPLCEVFPNFEGKSELHFAAEPGSADGVDVVFFATPNGVAMKQAPALLAGGTVKIIDLAADFRLSGSMWEQWYQEPHACPQLLTEAVYGLPELYRREIADAQVVANPGCYPTSVLLGFYPLLNGGQIALDCLIADVKSGVSGAGRRADVNLAAAELNGNFKAYKASAHRHFPEIKSQLERLAGKDVGFSFTPHLLPVSRGIHSTLYCRTELSQSQLQVMFEEAYADEDFVTVLKAGAHPQIRAVRGVNDCHIAVHKPEASEIAKVLVVIDNLVKGAAGQAVQNMNILFGLHESTGLTAIAALP